MHNLPFATPADVGLCPLRAQRLLDVLQSEIGCQRLPGAVALVARRGKVALFEHLGRQDPAAGTPMTRDSIFRHLFDDQTHRFGGDDDAHGAGPAAAE